MSRTITIIIIIIIIISRFMALTAISMNIAIFLNVTSWNVAERAVVLEKISVSKIGVSGNHKLTSDIFIDRQSLANSMRYTTNELKELENKILTARDAASVV